MKLYTEKQVKELLTAQRGNCYVAVLKLSNENIASAATQAPLPGGDSFDDYYGIDPESLFKEDLDDRELQGNYDRFQKRRESAKKSYNKYVPLLNYSVMEEQDVLIKRYEDWNTRKLFIHWNYLTMLKVTEVPYMEWRSEYEGIII